MTDRHEQPTEDARPKERAEEQRFERPDQARPRGNQEVEEVDVERGREKISRISGN
jgi:hypothetical protein